MTVLVRRQLYRARQALVRLWEDQLRWLIPTDPRGIVLCCFFAVAGGVGAALLFDGEPIGWGYLGIALAGAVFAQTRLMPTVLWLVVTGIGLWAVSAGAPAAWVEVAFAVVLAGISVLQVADPDAPIDSSLLEPQPNLSRTSAPAEVSEHGELTIRTLGRLQILVDGQDLAPNLLEKRVLGFIWCWLLAVAIRTATGSVSRAEMAAELVPGPNRRAQLERLRRQLWDLQHNLPKPLGALVCADRNVIRLDLASTNCDLLTLRELIAALSDSSSARDLSEADAKAQLEAISSERFLPEFDDLARAARHSRGAAMQAVNEVRTWAMQSRIDAARLLARRSRQLASSEE
jgi:hypothetical protein